MIKHESHSSFAGIDLAYASSKCRDQVVHRNEQDIGQDRPFQVAPESFDQIQVGTIRRQPLNLDPPSITFEETADRAAATVPARSRSSRASVRSESARPHKKARRPHPAYRAGSPATPDSNRLAATERRRARNDVVNMATPTRGHRQMVSLQSTKTDSATVVLIGSRSRTAMSREQAHVRS